jgi:outer membrane protein OmpA-like peptidoglycan-associated protein
MCRSRLILASLVLSCFALAPRARAEGVPFVGVDLGVSEPTNDNYRAHTETGMTGNPFVGYMFNKYIGLQGQVQITSQFPEREGNNTSAMTTLVGGTAGPRFEVPIGKFLTPYLTAQGGGYKGVHGTLNQWGPGFSVGGGIDVNLTEQFAVGLFGRWNRAYMSPHPTSLPFNTPDDQGPKDARWATAGVGIKYSFVQAAPAPPPAPPPPPPPPPPPAKKKIVLRSVHFDFNKSNIRPDARPVLDEAARTLKEEGGIAVICAGHTDSVGTDAYNMKLSRRRANAVRDYLVGHGIAASRIRTEGFGESRPVASNATADGRAQNRRVELNVE